MTTEYGGRLLYLGTGEETKKYFTLAASGSYPNGVDAGATGGLSFTYDTAVDLGSADYRGDFYLTGSNTTVCTIAGAIKAGANNVVSVSKYGTGTWKMKKHANHTNGGLWAVRNGTLQFDSLAERGAVCAFGTAENTFEIGGGTLASGVRVPYAFVLGGYDSDLKTNDTHPVFEYVGTDNVKVSTRPAVLDGEATIRNSGNGIFRFSGVSALSTGEKTLILDGDGVKNDLSNVTDDKAAGKIVSVVKRGSGTWRMANASSGLSGAIAVEDGTLKFDSIANRGTASSLGTALDLYRPVDSHGSALTEADQVGYAFLLGDGTEAHEGNFEYSGSASALCTTRPLALNGKGRLTNGSARGFTFADVYAVGAGKNVLTLDGDDVSANNVLSGVNDRKDAAGGPISIVKEGEGTWKLTGDLSLRGSIAVKKGTLVVQNNYTWYKWVVKSCYQEALGKSDIQFNLGEFGLYDAAGVRQNLGMTAQRADAGGNAEYPNLQPGHIDYGFTAADQFKPQSDAASYPRNLAKLVDDIITTGQISFWYQTKPDSDYYKEKTGGQSTYRNVPHNEPNQDTTWMPIVMRLKDDAMPIAYYDYATATANLREAYRTVLYGSVDGTNWEALESEDQCRAPVAAQWSFAQRAMVDGADAVHTNAQGQVDGRAIASVPAAYRAGYLTEVESYAVSSGATLKMRSNAQIRGLTIDCSGAGAGTIDGATFAANGTIDVTGLAKGVREASLKFDLVNASGFANVANWALTENGVPTTKLSVSVNEDGTVTIRRNGLMLIVR